MPPAGSIGFLQVWRRCAVWALPDSKVAGILLRLIGVILGTGEYCLGLACRPRAKDRRGMVMNGTNPAHRATAPNQRPVRQLLLVSLVVLGGVACGPGASDQDQTQAAHLTSSRAGELLSGSVTTSEPESPLAALTRTPRVMPTPEQLAIDSLGVDFGTDESPLRIIELFDYGCGYCRIFHQDTRTPLHEQYVDSGQLYWKSVPFVTGNWPASVPVSLAAECALEQGQSFFEAISDVIFERQSDWKAASEPETLADEFAQEVGLDMVRYRTCLEGDERLWRLQAHTRLAQDLGVDGTPTFFIVGVGPLTGALPLEAFQQVFDTVLVQVAAQQP